MVNLDFSFLGRTRAVSHIYQNDEIYIHGFTEYLHVFMRKYKNVIDKQ